MNKSSTYSNPYLNPSALAVQIKAMGRAIGFTDVKITHPNIDRAALLLKRWQALDNEGDMHYLQRHGLKRGHIHTITPDCLSIISVSLNYLPEAIDTASERLDSDEPYISLYARNRDYHKVMRKMLKQFAETIITLLGESVSYRGFVDTAPVLDKAYAEQSGIGWVGKHTNILDRQHGSFYFLGELAVNVKLTTDHPVTSHCGSCRACLDICPTKAITAPYHLDATRCISYLTIEHKGVIADELKVAIGNRIYGCDDCQLVCPWNRYAKLTKDEDFLPRQWLTQNNLLTLFSWDEKTFLARTEGSPIRRIGHACWQRNIAISIGNKKSLKNRQSYLKALRRHRNPEIGCQDAVNWAIKRLS